MAKRRRSKRARLWKLPQLDIEWLTARSALAAAGWVLAAGGLVAAWVLGVPRLEAYASARQAAGEIEVRFLDPPSWLDDDLETSLVLTAAELIDPDPRDRSTLMAARESLQASGWFD